MKFFMIGFLAMACGFSAKAATGLQDTDVVKFSFTYWSTVPAHDTGVVTVGILGLKSSSAPAAKHVFRRRANELVDSGVYQLVMKTYPKESIHTVQVPIPGKQSIQDQGFSGSISGKEINEAYLRASKECADCKLYFSVSQEFGWGFFDDLPVVGYAGIHQVGDSPSYGGSLAPDGTVTNGEAFHAGIDYIRQ